jgi:hypothetical protein
VNGRQRLRGDRLRRLGRARAARAAPQVSSHAVGRESLKRTPQPDVTVVVPTRNRPAFLAEAIESIRAQKFAGWEVVVVDDASDESSVSAARRVLSADPRLHLIELQEHSERSAARNIGLAHATGRYILFLDDDDRLLPTALPTLVAALNANADAAVAIGARRAFDTRGHTRRAPHPRFRVRKGLSSELLLGWLSAWVAVPGQCLLRTDRLRASGGWNETLVGPEDQELLLRLATDRPAILVPPVVLEYRLHGNQWRPPDVSEQENAFRNDIAQRLADAGHANARSLLRAGAILREAGASYDRTEYRSAFKLLGSAAFVAPSILTSPVIAPPFFQLWGKSTVGVIVGSTGARFARNGRGWCRRLLRRSPEAHVTVVYGAPEPPGRAGGYRAPDRRGSTDQ